MSLKLDKTFTAFFVAFLFTDYIVWASHLYTVSNKLLFILTKTYIPGEFLNKFNHLCLFWKKRNIDLFIWKSIHNHND